MSLPQVLCICAEELSESEKGKKWIGNGFSLFFCSNYRFQIQGVYGTIKLISYSCKFNMIFVC